jgi:hypothetical protein
MSHIETAIASWAALSRLMEEGDETYNPWSIVNLVFGHLAGAGLHPVLGEAGDPGGPAADLLRALGITPDKEGSRQASEQTKRKLAEIRAVFDDSADSRGDDPSHPPGADGDVSHCESP